MVKEQIASHLRSLPETKQLELRTLHELIVQLRPSCKLWFETGIDESGKVVANPTIGYGEQTLTYANGDSRPFFQIGICSTSTGISIYIIGLKDKNTLKDKFGTTIGKATLTGYCIKFKKLSDVNVEVLKEAIAFGFSATS